METDAAGTTTSPVRRSAVSTGSVYRVRTDQSAQGSGVCDGCDSCAGWMPRITGRTRCAGIPERAVCGAHGVLLRLRPGAEGGTGVTVRGVSTAGLPTIRELLAEAAGTLPEPFSRAALINWVHARRPDVGVPRPSGVNAQ